ncbi:hypothetical protein GCM10027612_17020 [Microbispora bryophytorum subsp. camponoti]
MEEVTTYDLPLSERGNAPPMNSLYVLFTASRSLIETSNLQWTGRLIGLAAPAHAAAVREPPVPYGEATGAAAPGEALAAPARARRTRRRRCPSSHLPAGRPEE